MKLDPQTLRDTSEGIMQSIDPAITPPNSVYFSQNLVFDKTLGRAVLRKGITKLGATVSTGQPCDGMFMYVKGNNTKIGLAAFNGKIYKYTSSWAESKTGLTADVNYRFVQFLDAVTAINITDEPVTYDGTDWTDTTIHDTSNFPSGQYVIEFKDRIYCAGVAGETDRLYYSSTPTAGAISWTTGNGYIDIEAEENAGPITGLAKVPGYLLVFKARSMKRWDTQSTYPESLITIGAPSQEAIVQTRQAVFYYNQRGIYVTTGGYPEKISIRIQPIIDAIPAAYQSKVSGWGTGEDVFFSIGDITLGDLTLTNCVIQYHIPNQTFAYHTFPSEILKWMTFVDSNGVEYLLGGDDAGMTHKIFNGVSDNGSAIPYTLQWNTQEFGARGRIKEFSEYVFYSKDVRNGNLRVKIDEQGDFKQIGTILSDVQEIKEDIKGRYFDFRVQGTAKDEISIIGLEFPTGNINMNFSE